MRSQEEKRTATANVRLSEEQLLRIQEKAAKHEMSLSSYMLKAAMNANEGFDSMVAVHAQNILNIAMRLARKYEPETVKELKKEEMKIWCM